VARTTTFEGKIIKETPLAFKFHIEGKEDFWVPKSQIKDPEVTTLEVGDEEEIEIPSWLAEKLDLE
jgi:hypothetical protein